METEEFKLEQMRREAERRGYVLLPVQTPLCPDCKAFAMAALNERESGVHQACA